MDAEHVVIYDVIGMVMIDITEENGLSHILPLSQVEIRVRKGRVSSTIHHRDGQVVFLGKQGTQELVKAFRGFADDTGI